ncbi:MAG TPA: hypothetical protein PLU43_04390 [Lachnospiraceae bacterium]|nr:hypothetical protein [Lachnospiraceae bacterium]
MKKKRLTSWERRQRRRIQIIIRAILLCVLCVAVIIAVKIFLPYETLNLSECFDVSYSGYNTKGSAVLTLDETKLDEVLTKVKSDYDTALFHTKECSDTDYDSFAKSISAEVQDAENLSNGSKYTVSYQYDESLAKKLNIKVLSKSSDVTVAGLTTPVVLTMDDLFQDIEVEFTGTSPNITMEIVNNSTNSFIQSMVFNPEEYQEYYATGDVVEIRAYFSEEECLKQHYAIDTPSEECIKEYTVEGTDSYVSSASELSEELIEEAITAGKSAFVNANEYGVRIFCEANLVPVYINKKATFEWLTPSLISAYFKSVKSEAAGQDGNNYNDLDLIYFVRITQADGVTCDAEAVVRFSNIIIKSDGTYEYDFSDPKIISASHSNASIVKNVVDKYEDTYEIEKLDYSEYY